MLLGNHAHQDVVGLEDLLVELLVVVEVALDFVNGQVDEHTGDLGSNVLADQLLNEGVDELSNKLFEVGVVRDNTREHGETLLVVEVDGRISVSEVSFVGSHNVDAGSNVGDWLAHLSLRLVGSRRSATLVSLLVGSTRVALLARAAVVEAALAAVLALVAVVIVLSLLVALDEHDDLLNQLEGLGLGEERGVEGGLNGLA